MTLFLAGAAPRLPHVLSFCLSVVLSILVALRHLLGESPVYTCLLTTHCYQGVLTLNWREFEHLSIDCFNGRGKGNLDLDSLGLFFNVIPLACARVVGLDDEQGRCW